MKDILIECKYCGACGEGSVVKANPPHAYKVTCNDCGKFHKWASKLDVEMFTTDEIILMIREEEDRAIEAARAGNIALVYKHLGTRDNYIERI